ncbi:T-complex protein 1 subunit beta [Tanacetum coccineum]
MSHIRAKFESIEFDCLFNINEQIVPRFVLEFYSQPTFDYNSTGHFVVNFVIERVDQLPQRAFKKLEFLDRKSTLRRSSDKIGITSSEQPVSFYLHPLYGDLNSTFGLSQVERLFKDEATEEKGERARMASFVGAMAIADLVKTTLGPKGMDKILQSTGRGHSVTVTNDGATILKSLHIDNPAAEVLIGYRMAADCARSALLERVKDNKEDAEKFRSDLMKIAMTTLSSKILSQDKEHFTTLAIAAVMSLKGSPKLESIQIIKKAGGSLKDSFDTVLKLDYHSSVYSCQLNMYVGNSFTFRRGDITMLDINLFVISHEKHTGTKIITYH